jgi:hypothetical protein
VSEQQLEVAAAFAEFEGASSGLHGPAAQGPGRAQRAGHLDRAGVRHPATAGGSASCGPTGSSSKPSTSCMAPRTARPTSTTTSPAPNGPGSARWRTDPREEQRHREQDHTQNIVAGVLEVAPNQSRGLLGRLVEPFGLGGRGQPALGHRERGPRGVGVGERPGRDPGVEGRLELGAEARAVDVLLAAFLFAWASIHWMKVATSIWVSACARLAARGLDPMALVRLALVRLDALVCSPFQRVAW